MCSQSASEYKVKDPAKYNFDPKKLLNQLIDVLINLRHKRFFMAIASDPVIFFFISMHPRFAIFSIDYFLSIDFKFLDNKDLELKKYLLKIKLISLIWFAGVNSELNGNI